MVIFELFNWLKELKYVYRYLIIIFLTILITTSWYFIYPRNDEVSRLGINSVRQVDLQAIDYIYNQENGKQGYLVLANQNFGAAAITRYGYGPYYQYQGDQFMYYAVPAGSKLNKVFDQVISAQNFDKEIINKTLTEFNLNKLYLITTDYWDLTEKSQQQAAKNAQSVKKIDDQITIYKFLKN